MYSSPEQRNADIEAGAMRPPSVLRTWFHEEAGAAGRRLQPADRRPVGGEVRTAQGREVPAAEIPWLRAREVMVHATDLRTGVSFADLPEDFLAALHDDIVAKRGADSVPPLEGTLADRVGYLAGRTRAGVTTRDGAPAPELPPWL